MASHSDNRHPAPPRWTQRPAARPEEILEAAQEVFGEYGFARAKLEEVARRAGVSKGTLYLYFDSKETLFREMVRARIVAAVGAAEALAAGYEGSYRDLLVQIVTRMFRILRASGWARITRLVQAELASFPELAQFYMDEAILPTRRLLDDVIRRGVAAGEFREVPHGVASRAIQALAMQAGQFQCFLARFDPDARSDEDVLEGLIDFTLHGLLVRPDPRS